MKKRLHHLREPFDLVLDDSKLMQKVLASARELRSVTHPHLIDRQADEVQRIFYLMCQGAGELTEGGKALEPVKFGFALAGSAKLRHHLVEAASEQPDFVAPARFRHRLKTMGGDILSGVGDCVNRLNVTLSKQICEDQSDCKDAKPQ